MRGVSLQLRIILGHFSCAHVEILDFLKGFFIEPFSQPSHTIFGEPCQGNEFLVIELVKQIAPDSPNPHIAIRQQVYLLNED